MLDFLDGLDVLYELIWLLNHFLLFHLLFDLHGSLLAVKASVHVDLLVAVFGQVGQIIRGKLELVGLLKIVVLASDQIRVLSRVDVVRLVHSSVLLAHLAHQLRIHILKLPHFPIGRWSNDEFEMGLTPAIRLGDDALLHIVLQLSQLLHVIFVKTVLVQRSEARLAESKYLLRALLARKQQSMNL